MPFKEGDLIIRNSVAGDKFDNLFSESAVCVVESCIRGEYRSTKYGWDIVVHEKGKTNTVAVHSECFSRMINELDNEEFDAVLLCE